MLVIGVTGGIGSGKTTVTDLFQSFGITVLDADVIARHLVEPGQPAVDAIAAHFGDVILTPEGGISRRDLRAIVFQQPEQRQWLEDLLHPKIRRYIDHRLSTVREAYCIVCMPLLLETKQQDLVDRILVVDVPLAVQIARVQLRDKLTDGEVDRIVQVQWSREKRLAQAHDIITNTMPKDELILAVRALHEKYRTIA